MAGSLSRQKRVTYCTGLTFIMNSLSAGRAPGGVDDANGSSLLVLDLMDSFRLSALLNGW